MNDSGNHNDRGALSNLPDEDLDVPLGLSEAPSAQLQAIDREERDIAAGGLNKVMDSIAYQRHEKDIDLERLNTGRYQPTEYAVDKLFPRKQVSLVSGHGESYKSMATLQSGICVATGTPFAGLETASGRVLFYSMEDGEDMIGGRLENMLKGVGKTHHDLNGNLVVRDMAEAWPPYIAEERGGVIKFTEEGERLLGEIESGCFDMVVIDNASEAYAADENSRPLVRQFMGRFRQAASAGDCAVVIIAHVNRMSASGSGGSENYSGSTQWHNSARSRIFMERDKDLKDAGVIKHEKLNTGRKLDSSIRFEFKNGALSFDAKGLRDREVSDGDKELRGMFHDLLETLQRADGMGQHIRKGVAGSANVHKCLQAIPSYPKSLQKAPRKQLVPAALNLMFEEGLVSVGKLTTSNRNTAETWEVTEKGRSFGVSEVEVADEAPF